MFADGTEYVSPTYTKFDYTCLNLSVNSSEADFQRAVDIFRDRIDGRFLEQIHILRRDCNKNGFAIMALECLLIETLGQFASGNPDNNGSSKVRYLAFLEEELHFPHTIANKFYSCIRCGILHQAQTKEHSALVPSGLVAVIQDDPDLFRVDVDQFVGMIDDYFEAYCSRLLSGADPSLRWKFICKMDSICSR